MSGYEFFQLSSAISYMLVGALYFAGIPLLVSIFKKRFGTGLLIFIVSAILTNVHVFAPLPVGIIGLYILIKDGFVEHKTEDTPEE